MSIFDGYAVRQQLADIQFDDQKLHPNTSSI